MSEKIWLGISLAAPMGPVTAEMIRRGLKKGFWAAFCIRLGAAIGNFLCLVIACIGLSQLMKNTTLLNILGLIGSVMLIYMGIKTFLSNKQNKDYAVADSGDNKGFLWGFYLAIFNPVSLMFWSGMFAASLDVNNPITMSTFIDSLQIIVGVLSWGAGLSLFLAIFRSILNEQSLRLISKLSGLLLLWFGAKYLYTIIVRIIY